MRHFHAKRVPDISGRWKIRTEHHVLDSVTHLVEETLVIVSPDDGAELRKADLFR